MTESESHSVRPASPSQRAAWVAGRVPVPEQVARRVWAIGTPIPAGTLPHTLTYLLLSDDGGVHVVDPGWEGDDGIRILDVALGDLGRGLADVRTVIATHFHPDHLGNAGRLRELTGARVVLSATERRVLAQETSTHHRDRNEYARRLAEWGVPPERRPELEESFDRPSLVADLVPDMLVADHEVVDLPGHHLEVVATPGHTDGHVCLVDAERRVMYTGDHVLPGIYSGIGIGTLPGSDALGDYLDSLDRLAPYDEFQALPGHEYRFDGIGTRRAAIAAHHLRRTAEVAALIPVLGDASVWEYARRLSWTAGWDGLDGFWLHSALRQTALHLDFVRSGDYARSGRAGVRTSAPTGPRGVGGISPVR
jgi:glyoxylase-like metal-dependent hydrolase (beta-lactamase superfamily II)